MFLPPKVPQEDDYHPELDLILTRVAEDGLSTPKSCTPDELHGAITAASAMLELMEKIHYDGDVDAAQLFVALSDIIHHGKRK